MHFWRYKGPNACKLVLTVDIPITLGLQWFLRGNYIRGVYATSVVCSDRNTLTVYMVNWLEGSQFAFKVKIVRTSQHALHYLTYSPSPAIFILLSFSLKQSSFWPFSTRIAPFYIVTRSIYSSHT
jgi:hypothetical protein